MDKIKIFFEPASKPRDAIAREPGVKTLIDAFITKGKLKQLVL